MKKDAQGRITFTRTDIESITEAEKRTLEAKVLLLEDKRPMVIV